MEQVGDGLPGTVPHRNPVPQEYSAAALVPGIPLARMWGDEQPPYADVWFSMSPAELKTRYVGTDWPVMAVPAQICRHSVDGPPHLAS